MFINNCIIIFLIGNFLYFSINFISSITKQNIISYKDNNEQIINWKYRTSIIYEKNKRQDVSTVKNLSITWNNKTIIGYIDPWYLLQKLNYVIDLTDNKLLSTSQFIHSLQVFQAMLNNNITSEKLLFLAMIHDIGKILVLYNEKQENVMCSTYIINKIYDDYCFKNILVSWNHDEFGYQKLKKYVSEDIAWVIRYHSLTPLYDKKLGCYLTEKEKIFLKLATIFRKYDRNFKNIYNVDYSLFNTTYAKKIVNKFLPDKILF